MIVDLGCSGKESSARIGHVHPWRATEEPTPFVQLDRGTSASPMCGTAN